MACLASLCLAVKIMTFVSSSEINLFIKSIVCLIGLAELDTELNSVKS